MFGQLCVPKPDELDMLTPRQPCLVYRIGWRSSYNDRFDLDELD